MLRRCYDSDMETAIRTAEVVRSTGATLRQVNYWIIQGAIPGQANDLGLGSIRHWTPEQLERVRLLRRASLLLNVEAATRLVVALDEVLSDSDAGDCEYALDALRRVCEGLR